MDNKRGVLMNKKYILTILMTIFINFIYAEDNTVDSILDNNLESSAMNKTTNIVTTGTKPNQTVPTNKIKSIVTSEDTPGTKQQSNVQYSNLDSIDKDTSDINQLNRKLQVEKIEAEIRKIKNNSNDQNASLGNGSSTAQTTVTGVAINAEGKKIAWLQFADGGDLMVNIGSKVGKFTVSNIEMTGVTLKQGKRKITLKRVYSNYGRVKNNSFSNKNTMIFTPSPIITGANSKSDYVPPIQPLGAN